MIPAAFDYVRAESAEHALELLGEHGDDAKLLAGGHSLIPNLLRTTKAKPAMNNKIKTHFVMFIPMTGFFDPPHPFDQVEVYEFDHK